MAPTPPLILDTREVTFLKVQNSNIYPIFRQKVPQNFWNMVDPPFLLPSINVQKRVQIGENKTTSNFGIPVDLPPLLDNVQKKAAFFFMASLTKAFQKKNINFF